ncbi:Fis family transcriptional regulator [Alysiella crassa]|uniref:Putative Fis-like DNA-binding protein n=1 Tax=Alysiella crassa TaxID=153491 RepID=A0A376BW51_9NEIS|nr:Fis family transcriptional regulator [Alysiella crassa]UOP08279.1 Fis family transcriptional regulator [Alysiella crassa]SSY81180.1 Hin recombinational enhancer-binding protein [Alysiella crassa]
MQKNAPDIAECITKNLYEYFNDLNGEEPKNVYEMVMVQVEKPLLQHVLEKCGGNQCKAAEILGMNRNTLRKKLLQHDLLS